MPDYCQPVQDYMRACEVLLKLSALSQEEAEAVEEMFGRIAEKFLDDGPPEGAAGKPNVAVRDCADL